MGQPGGHFEIIGADPPELRRCDPEATSSASAQRDSFLDLVVDSPGAGTQDNQMAERDSRQPEDRFAMWGDGYS